MEYDPQCSPEDNKETDVLLPVAKYNISKLAKLKGGTKQPCNTAASQLTIVSLDNSCCIYEVLNCVLASNLKVNGSTTFTSSMIKFYELTVLIFICFNTTS